MDFFTPPVGEFPAPEDWDEDAWSSPPYEELGQRLEVGAILGRSKAAVIALRSATVYSTGFLLEMEARVRFPNGKLDDLGLTSFSFGRSNISPNMFMVGIELPDGTRATNIDLPPVRGGVTRDLHLDLYRGSGNSYGKDVTWWVWPLLPAVQCQVVCQWRAYEIDLNRYPLDGAAIRRAALQSMRLFD